MPKFWFLAKRLFIILINRRLLALNVLILFVGGLLLFLVIPKAAVKPLGQAVNIIPAADTVTAMPVPQGVDEQTSLPGRAIVASGAVGAALNGGTPTAAPNGVASTAAPASTAAVDKPWRDETPQLPLSGKVILAYGWQLHPVFNDWRYHTGIDIAAEPEKAVTAALSGIVATNGEAKHTGLTVVIVSGRRQLIYGCLSRTKLSVGQKVSQGEVIGWTGQSAAEPYPHLHFAYKLDDEYQDPLKLFE